MKKKEYTTAVDWLKDQVPHLFQEDSGNYAELFEMAKQLEIKFLQQQIGWYFQAMTEPNANDLIEEYNNKLSKA